MASHQRRSLMIGLAAVVLVSVAWLTATWASARSDALKIVASQDIWMETGAANPTDVSIRTIRGGIVESPLDGRSRFGWVFEVRAGTNESAAVRLVVTRPRAAGLRWREVGRTE